MQKQHRLAMRADFRLAVAEHARALCLQGIAGGADVGHLVADVVDAAVGIAFEEFGDRRALAERLQQFDLGVGQRDEHGGDAVVGLLHLGRDFRAQRVAIDLRRLGDVAHRDGDVIETTDHRLPLVLASAAHHTVKTCTWHIGFLPQRCADRRAHRAAHRLGHRIGIAAALARQRFQRFIDGVIDRVRDQPAVAVAFRNADQVEFRVGRQHALPR